tara:strand:- start:3426 stop:4571 length:1146 start_codon:yes stop_codon:yes gene_type:complete
MIVKFHDHGKGPASGATNYLLKERDESSDNPESKPLPLKKRKHARVLSGDPVLTEQLINTIPYKQKYKSGVLSFEKRADELTEKQKFEIMKKFEEVIFCGLERDQYDILWIEHADKDIDEAHPVGRLELNFLIPGQELRSGKRLQPFYAGADLVRVNAFKNVVNYEYSLADPDEPKRARLTNSHATNSAPPSPNDTTYYGKQAAEKDAEIIKNPPNLNVLREAVHRRMEYDFNIEQIKSREGVLLSLRRLGLKVERANSENSISVSSKKLKDKHGKPRHIRLEGGIYKKDFDANKKQEHTIEAAQRAYVSRLPREYERNKRTLAKGIEIKEKYHAGLYKDAELPEPFKLNVVDIPLEIIKEQLEREPARPSKHLDTPTMGF